MIVRPSKPAVIAGPLTTVVELDGRDVEDGSDDEDGEPGTAVDVDACAADPGPDGAGGSADDDTEGGTEDGTDARTHRR